MPICILLLLTIYKLRVCLTTVTLLVNLPLTNLMPFQACGPQRDDQPPPKHPRTGDW